MAQSPPPDGVIDQDVPGRQVINDDLEVIGSLGVGNDTQPNQAYGFDTVILRENNLRMFFDDTSNSANFPNNDWGFEFNESTNGGNNWFRVLDRTSGNAVFVAEAGARNNALYVEADGDVGIGTNSPAVDLEIQTGDTPTVRLEQDNTSGFTPQSWDVAGNEANFFIRDATNGSTLPFRIRPGAPTSAIDINGNGAVGIHNASPNANASLDLGATNRGLLLNRMDTAARTALGGALTPAENGMVVFDTDELLAYVWDGVDWVPVGTDDQSADVFQLTGNDLELSLEDDGVANNVVDLSGYLDNTDDQTADVFQLTGNDLELSLEDDGVANNVVDLSGYLDNTDDQMLALNGNSLDLEDGGSVDLSGYLDNTDDQQLTLDNTLNILSLEDGGSVDLTPFKMDSDDQILTEFSLTGTMLKLEIEDGNFLEVDISTILAPLEARVTTLETQMIDVLERLDIIEECACDGTLGGLPDFDATISGPRLFQNVPNPFDNTTSISYFVPFKYNQANIVISSSSGKILNNIALDKLGEGSIDVNKSTMQSAVYFYSLYVDGKRVDTKRMVVK
ncbi:MAG: hypothetical protein HKO54_05370 [Flavobacteriaceae bacterium]|nr:hypothetical protein [Flavobacteriaceae bacterium]